MGFLKRLFSKPCKCSIVIGQFQNTIGVMFDLTDPSKTVLSDLETESYRNILRARDVFIETYKAEMKNRFNII